MPVETLTEIMDNGFLDRGELSELTGRHLLLDAYHRAVELEQADRPEETPPNFSAGCRLITIINALYNDEDADLVLNSTPDNVKGVPFREAFKDALICFTHFGKFTDDTGVTSTAAWVAFVRHMAIICRNDYRTIDCILPVLLWDTQLCEHVITGVLIQFKRRKHSGTTSRYSIDQTDFNFFPPTLEKCTHGSNSTSYQPYVSLVMELGVQVKSADKEYKPEKHSSSSNARSGTPPPMDDDPDHATPFVQSQGHRKD